MLPCKRMWDLKVESVVILTLQKRLVFEKERGAHSLIDDRVL